MVDAAQQSPARLPAPVDEDASYTVRRRSCDRRATVVGARRRERSRRAAETTAPRASFSTRCVQDGPRHVSAHMPAHMTGHAEDERATL